jgi:hypothetical protein
LCRFGVSGLQEFSCHLEFPKEIKKSKKPEGSSKLIVFDCGSRSFSWKLRGACFGVFWTHVENRSTFPINVDLKKKEKISNRRTPSKTREQNVLGVEEHDIDVANFFIGAILPEI